MTIRFDKDRMYLHNDGYTIDERFVNNISKIFEQSKKADPETSGNLERVSVPHTCTRTPRSWSGYATLMTTA